MVASHFVGLCYAISAFSTCLSRADAYNRASLPTITGAQVQEVDKKTEFRSFILLCVFLAPALSIAIVGGYGFIVWMSQILLDPPG